MVLHYEHFERIAEMFPELRMHLLGVQKESRERCRGEPGSSFQSKSASKLKAAFKASMVATKAFRASSSERASGVANRLSRASQVSPGVSPGGPRAGASSKASAASAGGELRSSLKRAEGHAEARGADVMPAGGKQLSVRISGEERDDLPARADADEVSSVAPGETGSSDTPRET